MENILHRCKLGTYNASCKYKVNKVLCCAENCGFLGDEVGDAEKDNDNTKALLKHEPKWFEKYYD